MIIILNVNDSFKLDNCIRSIHKFVSGLNKWRSNGRNNANNKDLGRDFPKIFDEPQDVNWDILESGRQPETVALMRWVQKEPFVLSSVMHGGALVATYTYDDTPREGRFVFLIARFGVCLDNAGTS